MEQFLKVAGGFLFLTLVGFIISLVSGTILWAIYPHINALFPTAADNGLIAKNLHWWDSVCITWILTVFIKSSSSSITYK